ncbi:Gfo/Idh/MocA family oxidoreductase [Candidatus Aerophobetes bacterium]|nr:Gfo/Idh/MocA family oxidoreductase [Candidatus Aerophobetes bacterium]
MKKINVGMVGYKFMGKAHSHAYLDMPFFFSTEVVPVRRALCGRTEKAVAEAAQKFGWESYETSWKRLIEREDIDLIDITTPNNTHKEIAIVAAKAGKDIICEKPLATNLNDAQAMLKAVESTGVKHMICFNYRKVPAISLAKKLIEEGKLGEIYHFRAVYLQDWIIDPEFPLVWRLQKNIAGSGAHGDLNSHLIDLARYLIGEFDEVIGMDKTFIKERPTLKITEELTTGLATAKAGEEKGRVEVDDATLFLAKFKRGALGSFEATRFATGHRNGQKIEINGSKGSLIFEFEQMNELKFYSTEDSQGVQGFRTIKTTEEIHPYMKVWWPVGHIIGYEHTFVHLIYDFMEAINQDKIPAPNFVDGVRCQEVLEAVERSIKERRWVSIEEVKTRGS